MMHHALFGEPAPIKSGDTVIFAEVAHAHYYSPRDFYDVMRLKLRSGKTRRLQRAARIKTRIKKGPRKPQTSQN